MPLTNFTWYSFIAITDNYYLLIFTKDSLNYLKLGIGCSRLQFRRSNENSRWDAVKTQG